MASTQSSEQDYLYELDDSDVCLFLIDNADGASDAVLREINRAKVQKKKCLYLFCKEQRQKPTQIQEELKGAKGARYYETTSFNEFISKGYISLLNDITEIYKHYCKGRLIDKEFEKDSVVLKEIEPIVSEPLNEQLLKEIDQSKEYLSSIIFKHDRKINGTSEFDSFCKEFLKVIFGKKKIQSFNTSLLLEELKKKQRKNLYEVVELRWKAIQAYYNNDLATSIQYAQQSLNIARINLLPKWFIADILIDLRNLQSIKGATENCYSYSEAQKALDENNGILFYPVLDRFEEEYNQKLLEQIFENETRSPYTTYFGNNIDIYTDFITNIFVVAVFNGSLTHIIKTIRRLKCMAFNLCEQYDDWQFRILLLKFSIIAGDGDDIEKVINTFNEILGKMNASDAISIYEMVNSIPISYKKTIAKLEVFRHFGYYFSDRDYQSISEEILEEIKKWIYDDKGIVTLGGYIFKALQSNLQRLDNTEIAEICCNIFQRKYRRFYDDVFKLISKMGINEVKNEVATSLIFEIIKIISDERERGNCNFLREAIITIQKSKKNPNKELENCISEKMPEFYHTTYSLEILTDTIEESEAHIQRYIEEIRNRNETQGINGKYIGYGDNPYLTIINILKNDHIELNCELIERISNAAVGTLLKPKQTISAKIDSVQLLIFLKNFQFRNKYNFSKLYNNLIENQDVVETGALDGLFDKKSKLALQFNFLLLQLCFDTISDTEILEYISIYNNQDDYEKIESLYAITNLMDSQYVAKIDERTLYIFVQYALGFCNTKSHDIRYNAVKALIKMCTPKTSKVIMTQLSKMMDADSAPIKFLMINNIEHLKKSNEEIADLILQKAKVDNHFTVRKKASEILSA